MKFITLIIAVIAFAVAAFAGPIAEPAGSTSAIVYCGSQPYKTTEYTCYPDPPPAQLCPITNGVVYKRCDKACYNPSQYVCKNGYLCPSSDPNLCGTACYNSTKYYCDNGILRQK